MNSREVLDTLGRHYPTRSGAWTFVEELAIPCCREVDWMGGGRIDAFAVACWASLKYERHAFEVKVSRADLRNELANPYKRSAAVGLSNRFYFVLAAGIDWLDLPMPEDCGVMVAHSRGITIARKAPHRDVPPLPAPVVASLVRRASGWLLNPVLISRTASNA